jgi:conjugal transfer/type IV secretion protein DotA/TraY
MQRVSSHTIILLTAVALFGLAPVGDAMAAGPPSANALFGMATPDAPIQWLQNAIQGSNAPTSETFLSNYGIYNNNGGGSIQAGLQAVLSYYSYGMLVIGSFLLLYYLVRMIAETAHTGRPGGRANQLWAPIRTVLAIGLLVPLATGLNSGQMIVLNLASEGSALASNTWALFVSTVGSNIAQGASAAVSSQSSADAQSQAVYSYFMTQVCVSAYNQLLSQSGFTGALSATGLPAFNWQMQANTSSMPPSGTLTGWGNGWDQTECGQMQTESPAVISPPAGANQGTGGSSLSSQMSTTAAGLSTTIINAENNAWQNDVVSPMSAPVNTYLTAVMANNPAPVSIQTTLAGYIQKYNADLSSGVASAVSTASGAINTALNDDAAALGWLSAGSMYMTIARLNSTISEAMMYAPSVSAPDMGKIKTERSGGKVAMSVLEDIALPILAPFNTQLPPSLETRLTEIMSQASNLLAVQGTGANSATAFTLESGQVAAASGPETNTGGLLKIINIIMSKIQGTSPSTAAGKSATDVGNSTWLGNMVPTGGFPISDLSVVGSNLLKMGGALYLAATAASVSVVGNSAGSGLATILFAFGTVLFAPGIALAYVLPLLPFMHFLFAVFGWLLALVEAVIEVPLFALAHLDPEGEGVLPQATRQGYHLLLQLILRPLLIIIGLIVSILLMNGMIDFLNLIFNATVFGVQTSSNVNMFSQIVYTVIYASIAYSICNACFKAIDYIPNHALRWIGGSGDQHDSGGHVGHATSNTMATAAVANQIGQAAPQIVGGIVRGVKSQSQSLASGFATGAGGGAGGAAGSGGALTGPAGGGGEAAAQLASASANSKQVSEDSGKGYKGMPSAAGTAGALIDAGSNDSNEDGVRNKYE